MAKIVCRGYGSPHGFAAGRLWFVCAKCRWSPGYRDPEPAPSTPQVFKNYKGDPVSTTKE